LSAASSTPAEFFPSIRPETGPFSFLWKMPPRHYFSSPTPNIPWDFTFFFEEGSPFFFPLKRRRHVILI